MKRLAVSVVAGIMLATPAPAEEFGPDATWITLSTAGMMVAALCPDYEPVVGGMQVMADRSGVHYDVLLPAVTAAWSVAFGHPYDRTKLIPEVTQLVRSVVTKAAPQLKTRKGCAQYAKKLDGSGLIQPVTSSGRTGQEPLAKRP